MSRPPHDERRLPRWAQAELADLRGRARRLEDKLAALEAADDVLRNRDWCALHGPRPGPAGDGEPYHLWFLYPDRPFPVATLHEDDVLLVGRSRRWLDGLAGEAVPRRG